MWGSEAMQGIHVIIFATVSALFTLITAVQSFAITTEISLSYSSKKTSFDKDNYVASQSITGSVSFYIFERTALELSYTDALAVREEKILNSTQTVVQTTQVYGADLIYVFADKTSVIQPYIKGGVANIRRRQESKKDNLDMDPISPDPATVPSYGVGLKLLMTQTFSFKISYDAWKTPLEEGAYTDDAALRAGVSLVL